MKFYKKERNLKIYIGISGLVSLAMVLMMGLYFAYDGGFDFTMIVFFVLPICVLIPMLIKMYNSYRWLKNKLPILNFTPHQLIIQLSPKEHRTLNYHELESFQTDLNSIQGRSSNLHEEFLQIKLKNEKSLEIPVLDLNTTILEIKQAADRYCQQVPWLPLKR